jgi:hypothetical protein
MGTLADRARGVFGPAVDAPAWSSTGTLGGLRILAGLLWLYNVSWKRPPDFGEDNGSGLFRFTNDAVDHPVLAPYSWVVEELVLPNFQAFGWMVLAVETTLAVMLLTGTMVRVAAALGVAQSTAIALSVAQTPGEWPWSYWMMIGIHVVLLGGAAGSFLAVDRVRAVPRAGRRLLAVWGVVVGATACIVLVMSIGESATAVRGAQLGGPDLSISLGSYNLVGAIVLLAVAALMLAAAAGRQPMLALVGAALAVVAAVSLYVQLGFSDPLLGGSNTSAAFFLCAAVVAAVCFNRLSVPTEKS